MNKNTATPKTSPVEDCPSCPNCGETAGFWPADYVDNGVGMQQCGPAHCDNCGWSEPSFDQFFNTPAQTTTNPSTQPVSGSGERIIRCFCYPAPPSQSNRGSDVIAVAIDERGATLSVHYCSNDSFAEHDIQNMGHGKKYDDRYPDGWSTVWLGREMPADWDGNPQYLNTKKEENL